MFSREKCLKENTGEICLCVLRTNNQIFLKEFHTTETTYTKYNTLCRKKSWANDGNHFRPPQKVSGCQAKMAKRESGQAFERRSCGRNTRMPKFLLLCKWTCLLRPQIWANVSCPTPKLLFCSARDNEFLPVFIERAVNAHHFCYRQRLCQK